MKIHQLTIQEASVVKFTFIQQEQYRGIEEILKKSLKLLQALAKGNDVVQMRMFERLDTLMKIKVVESDLSICLKEVCYVNVFDILL